MRIDLRCKLRAYAKLSINGGTGGDDFLKKIMTTPKDTLIDLGYKDAVSGREVYALRRSFQFTSVANIEYKITLANNLERVLAFNGTLSVDNHSLSLPGRNTVDELIIEDNEYYFTFVGGNYEYRFDVYFVFIGNKEYLTQEDIGDLIIEGERFNLNTVGDAEFFIYDDKGNRVYAGYEALEGGVEYTIEDVVPYTGYILDEIRCDGELISIPYRFICERNTSVVAETSEPTPVEKYSLHVEQDNCLVHVYDLNDNEVYPGEDVLNNDERYYLNVEPLEGYTIVGIFINNSTVDPESLPYYFIVDEEDIRINAVARPTDRSVTLMFRENTDTPISSIKAVVGGVEYESNEEGYIYIDPKDVPQTPFTISVSDPRKDDENYDMYYDVPSTIEVMYLPFDQMYTVDDIIKPYSDVLIFMDASDPRPESDIPVVNIVDNETGVHYHDNDRIPANRSCTLSITYNHNDWQLNEAMYNEEDIIGKLPYTFTTESGMGQVWIVLSFLYIGDWENV